MAYKGYTQLPSGFWTKDSDASSPYLFDGDKMIFMGDSSGSGGSVDVLGTVISDFEANSSQAVNGDTVQVAFNKLSTLQHNFNTKVSTTPIMEFKPQDIEIHNGDTVKICLEKLQGQVRTHRVETEEEVRNSTLDGFVAINSPITSSDNVLGAFGKAQGQIESFNSKIGEVNGLAPLNADKKIPLGHLPAGIFRFMGHYDARTNTPELKNDGASLQGGEVYQCSVAGSLNGINLEVGDLIVYEYSTKKWVKSLASGEVVSVNGKTGNVVINGSNITVSDSDKRTLEEALSTESSRVSVLTPLNTDKASGYIEFAGIRWGYERTNLTGGRQFFQSVTGSIDISYTQKAFFDAGIEVNRSVSSKATTTKNYYDPLSLSDLRELAVIHVFVNNQLWRVNQLVIGTSIQMLAMWAERVA